MTKGEKARPWADPDHPGNAIRPHVRCLGCRRLGCGTAWGAWCVACNTKRIERINKALGIGE